MNFVCIGVHVCMYACAALRLSRRHVIIPRYRGHDRFVVSSPVINGFCGWVTDLHCQRDSDAYKKKQRRFQHVVATLVQMPLQHSYLSPTCGNGLPHEARILLRAVASGYVACVAKCVRLYALRVVETHWMSRVATVRWPT